jgi:catechol 2,3-dioxygenase-like lactoylglutathione lyase family enzyme
LIVERTDFITVPVTEMERSKQFYGETLGLPIETEGENDLEFTLGQVTLDVFNPASSGQEFAPSPAGIAIRVPDVAAARAELEEKGVRFDGDIVDTGVCHFAFFKDPDGNQLMLHRRYAPREA